MEKDNKTILTPGASTCSNAPETYNEPVYLQRDNYLNEFADDSAKALARANLGVLSSAESMRANDIQLAIAEAVANSMSDHLSKSDPHNIMTQVNKKLGEFMRLDGMVGFQNRVSGKDPVSPDDLSTKRYVDSVVNTHIEDHNDPHDTMQLVREALKSYALACDVYAKSQTYSQVQIDTLIRDMVKTDGSTPFIVPQKGVYPVLSSDLAVKAYVDDVMKAHKLESDPHNMYSYIEDRLKLYAKAEDVYTKEETYSRPQIESKIESLMTPVVEKAITKHVQEDDPHHTMESVRAMEYVKADGTVPFKQPQSGVPGIKPEHLATIGDVEYRTKALSDKFDESVESCIWKTSGPVQTTVGYVEDNSILPDKVNFQQIMDKIFYGDGVGIDVKEYAQYGEIIDVVMNIRPTLMIDIVKLYQGDKLIGTFDREDFEPDGSHTVKSNPITEDPTIFKMEVTYTNGNIKTVTAQTSIAYGVYVGIMPKWMHGMQMTIDYMESQILSDPTNNKKFFDGSGRLEYEMDYLFNTPDEPKSLFIAMPTSYPNLSSVDTVTQQFPANQFECIDNIVLTLADGKLIMYKIYIFPVGIVELNMKVIYKLQK